MSGDGLPILFRCNGCGSLGEVGPNDSLPPDWEFIQRWSPESDEFVCNLCQAFGRPVPSSARLGRGGKPSVLVTVRVIEPNDDDGRGKTVAACVACGHKTRSYGTHSRSLARCLALLNEGCPRGEDYWYVTSPSEADVVAALPEVSIAGPAAPTRTPEEEAKHLAELVKLAKEITNPPSLKPLRRS